VALEPSRAAGHRVDTVGGRSYDTAALEGGTPPVENRLHHQPPMTKSSTALLLAAALTSAAAPGHAQDLKILAFGDSMTFGIGDPAGLGYPERLENALGDGYIVLNFGEPGEDTSMGLSRIGEAFAQGGDVLLLMEGTNDVTLVAQGELSIETTLDNIDLMISRTRDAQIEPVLASIVPRSPEAKRDRSNSVTAFFVGELREEAIQRNVRFADAYDLFDPELVPDYFEEYFDPSPDDPVGHLNGAGYDRLAGRFADLLTEIDSQAPVVGNFDPGPLPNFIPRSTRITVPVFDFKNGSGLDLAETKLLINGAVVATGLDSDGDSKKVELSHKGKKALGCRAVVQIRAQDRAAPPNVLDRALAVYGIMGRTVRAGDVDFDCFVDGVDLVQVALRIGLTSADAGYGLVWDLNRDQTIDAADLEILVGNFGTSSL